MAIWTTGKTESGMNNELPSIQRVGWEGVDAEQGFESWF